MALPVGVHTDTFDVAGAQGPPTMHEPTLDDRGVADELHRRATRSVHPTDGVLPVLIGHLSCEHDIEEVERAAVEHRSIDVGCVTDLDVERSRHRRSRLPTLTNAGDEASYGFRAHCGSATLPGKIFHDVSISCLSVRVKGNETR